ncbi:MAG: hypothetical protein OXU27_11245 [Candidatus Poribacteria bacterium]|nr:hypothetical protein [Candidatus Poribacteria bacterium]
MTPETWVEKCIETTHAADVDKQTRATLLFALSIFGSLAHPPELFQDRILEEIMQESPFYERVMQRGIAQGIEQGREQGREQGARQTNIENTIAILSARFPNDDANALKPKLEAIDDLKRLKQLNLNASLVTNFRQFQQQLEA